MRKMLVVIPSNTGNTLIMYLNSFQLYIRQYVVPGRVILIVLHA